MCLNSVMDLSRRCFAALALSAMLALSGCTWPISDPVKLSAIRAEAEVLRKRHPIEPPRHWVNLPKSQWPPVIASLKPESVTVFQWGINISIKPYFDGGWGYHVSRSRRELPMLEGCYSEISDGVFWHGPC